MPRPLLSSNVFSTDQAVVWSVSVFNTPHTVESKGMVYRPATLLSTFGASIDFSTATLSAMTSHFDSNTTPGIVDASGTEIQGRIPIIYDYWGTQAPLGVNAYGSAAIRIKGYIKTTGTYGFSVHGNGNIKIYKNSSSLLFGTFTDSNPKYMTAPQSFTAGDQIDIFYWGKNLNWGGLAIRVFTDEDTVVDGEIDWDILRDTDLLSASFMDSGETVTETVLDFVEKTTVESKVGQTTDCDIIVTSAKTDDLHGWRWDHTNKLLKNVETDETIKIGQLVKVTGGVLGDNHPLFTGNILDITPEGDSVNIKCSSFEQRLSQQLSENYPDRTAYAAFGYTDRSGVANPAWSVPAYDHWPYEHALKDMLSRAWVDSSLLNGTKTLKRVGETTTETGSSLFYCRDLSGNHIRIQRQPNYGNPEGLANLPPDDPYLTTSELTQTLYRRIIDLSDRIGYDFRSDPEGNIVFTVRNNPSSINHVTGGTNVTHPSAIGGVYQKFTGGAWSVTIPDIKASRLELVVGVGSGLGVINVAATRQEDSEVFNTQIDTSQTEEYFYYDRVLTTDLTNITSYTILSGEDYGTFDVVITPYGGTGSTEYRLDSIRIFEQDPIVPISIYSLSNFENITSVSGKSNYTDRINDAIVTGTRKAAITDSQKALDKVYSEFVVSRATDLNAIFNPSSINFDGRKITAFLSNESIADQDLADWTSRTLVSRYRLPDPDIKAEHTIIPVIELRDPVYIADESYDSFDSTKTRWVIGYTHTFEPASATTALDLISFQETPSYEPREEIDISNYNYKPVINLSINYPSLNGTSTITDIVGGQPVPSTITISSGVLDWDLTLPGYHMDVDGTTMSPGSDLLKIASAGGSDADVYNSELNLDMQFFKNNPYHKFYTKNGTRLDLDWEMADGSADYVLPGWGIKEAIEVGNAMTFSFRAINDEYSGTPPFYDPYYSELSVPELVNISFDALISGYYRVSIVDARGKTPTTVAWLTNPGHESVSDEDHWQYITAGPTKTFTWDGVDNIGTWNRTQSEEYSWSQKGSFDNIESPVIGRGFYAANDQTTGITHISDETDGGVVVYPVSKYAQFFVRIETLRQTDNTPLIVESNTPEDVLDTAASQLDERYIYYHLPQPNKVSITIEDWDATAGAYAAGGTDWTTLDPDATISDDKPVKVSITAEPRLGVKFNSDLSLVNVKVNKCVHLSAQILDEFAIFFGEVWNSKSSSEKKSLVSRRITDDNHTLIFSDDSFTSGDSITDWVFYPSLFEKDFGRGEEALAFRDYLQLQEVPSWNPHRRTGEERSRFLLGLMSYLFYMSVYTQDRSGRLVWAVDKTFVDQSKILQNTDTTEFPFDLERHQRRTIFVRQWWDYNLINADLGTTWSVPQKHYGGYADVWDFHHRVSDELFPLNIASGTYVSGTVETSYQDPYSLAVYNANRLEFDNGITSATLNRDLGNLSNTVFGSWTWETDGFVWIPNITRDFHPFYIVPPMALCGYLVDASAGWTPWWEGHYWYAITESPPHVVADEAKHDSYFTAVYDYSTGDYNTYKMIGGVNVVDEFKDNKENPLAVGDTMVQIQRQDDIKHYENCRGAMSNGPKDSRDIINIVGGDPYYLNTKMYRYFRMNSSLQIDPSATSNKKTEYYNDVARDGFFFLTFRHTYNWESPSLFPVDPYKYLFPSAIDGDLTGSPIQATSTDPGAWAGWKDDHPSATQEGVWKETGTCTALHWRNDYVNNGRLWSTLTVTAQAGGSCEIEDPTIALTDEDLPRTYVPNNNIFLQKMSKVTGRFGRLQRNYMPLAVGPRLPQTRRVLLSMFLLNSRRTTAI